VAIAARYKGYRYPIEVIGHAVRLYHRFALSLSGLARNFGDVFVGARYAAGVRAASSWAAMR